jgi:Fe-S oxidoreductase
MTMSNETGYIADKRYVKGDPSRKPDYGWKFHGNRVLIHEDYSIAYNDTASQMEAALRETSMEFFVLDRCLQCGMCTSWCPNSLITSEGKLTPRELIQKLRLGLLDLSGQELWFCTNCGGCTTNCPYEVPLIDVIISLRKLVVNEGAGYLPATIKSVLSSVKTYKNPWMEEPEKRTDWLAETGIQPSNDKEAILLFAGCSPSYDSRAKKIARAAVKLLNRIGIKFDTLGVKEACCGDGVMRVGDFDAFHKLKTMNKSNIETHGARDIYTLSPHCSHIMKTNYFENYDEQSVSVKPFVMLLYEAMENGSLIFSKPIKKTITYHDPCFLAKHNSICEEPREILKSIEGLTTVEMEHNRKAGICCGGGGGGIWLDRKKGERLGEVRLEEALSAGAETIVTACPFCLSMLEDAAKGESRFEHIEIMDICELALNAL